MRFILEKMFGWVPELPPVRWILALPWERLNALSIGEKLALVALALCATAAGLVAINRFLAMEFSDPLPRKQVRTPRRKKGFGLRYLVVLAAAVLPGGLIAAFTVPLLMGKEGWRQDALKIFLLSLIPIAFLALLRLTEHAWLPAPADFWISAIFGLTFSMLQAWLTIKLLREGLGEPEECVPWWPPLAWLGQVLGLLLGLRLAFYGWPA
ncbi:MAG TPA: hypothetical protein VEJ63_14865 [Planctomycetota bacterium]|nr:hypothetical protein [Planctomycetota bacterium]